MKTLNVTTKTKYKIEEEIDEQNTGLEKYVEIEREYTDENGNVIKEFTIQNAGTHKISAFTYGVLGNRSLINSIIVVKSDITLSVQPQDITMEYGTTQSITASTKNTGDIIWTSSDESVATVSETGVVTAKKLGTATITATASVDNTVSATCEVTVTGFVNSETAETADGYTAPTVKNTNTEPGEYKLIPSSGTATNYSFEYVEGTLKIDLPIFTISYELNDGELENGKTNPDNYTQKSEDIILNNPTKSGYEFIGWSLTKLNGVAQDASTPSTSVTIAKGSKGNREYTANWNLVAPTVSVTVENSEVNLFDDVATTFTANVENAVNPTYQWYYNDTKITGATSSIYSISTTEMTESNYVGGNYSVAVTNNEAPSSSALGETNENTTSYIENCTNNANLIRLLQNSTNVIPI